MTVGIRLSLPVALAIRSSLRSPVLRLGLLDPAHRSEAAALLARTFARREPLSRHLGIAESSLRPLFSALLDHVLAHGRCIAATDETGRLLGVMVCEDEAVPFVPPRVFLTPALHAIHAHLDRHTLPDALRPDAPGQVYSYGLAAVASGAGELPVARSLMLEAFTLHGRLGYTAGIARVSNPKITRRVQRLAEWYPWPVLRCLSVLRPADLVLGGVRPFADYTGETALLQLRHR